MSGEARAAEGPMQARWIGCWCCGVEIPHGIWCGRCLADHIGTHGALWDRTYFSQFGQDCPYQVRLDEETR